MKPLPCLWSQSVAMSYRRNPCRRNNWFPDRRRYGGRNSDQQPQLQPAPPPPPPRRRRPQYSTVPPRPPSGTDYGPFSSYPYSLSPILRGPWKGPRPCINKPPKPYRDQDFYENALTGPCEPIHLENYHEGTKLFVASEGFHYEELDLDSTFRAGGAIHRINPESECAWGLAQTAAVFAIGSHNKTEGTNLTLRRVERVVETVGPYGIFFFITLQASDDSFYETKVHGECFPASSVEASVNAQPYCGLYYEFTLNFFRRAVHHPSVQWDYARRMGLLEDFKPPNL